jgi:hypothetical protein
MEQGVERLKHFIWFCFFLSVERWKKPIGTSQVDGFLVWKIPQRRFETDHDH